ncbi:MAG: ATP-binding protein [Anaerolineaceae bacterium]|jgi:serine/threonine-protein kinase RsbW|nr:ATP-binding protein [Anaerolineaceae bacterium]OQY88706.1 MAG: hypothetical protein B6D38_10080 [Anaerolineae bacterium UTCFX1]
MQTLRLPARFDYLDEIREFVGNIARQNGFDGKDVYNIQLAADEAASNIIEHAYKDRTDGEIQISCGLEAERFTVVLVDYGKSFNPSHAPLPNLSADLAKRRIGGLGIFLIYKLMDEVYYQSNPDKSNTLTLVKRRA